MGYLTLSDYRNSIQQSIFNQLVQNNYAKLTLAENTALDIVISHLAQKYDVTQEFTDIGPWNPFQNYRIRTRVVIDYPEWDSTVTYNTDDCVIYEGMSYMCLAPNTGGVFKPAAWQLLGPQYEIYFASFPQGCSYQGAHAVPTLADPVAPMFDINKNYFLNDVVYWNNAQYQCNMATATVQTGDLKQYYVYENVPLPNVLPDDPINNADEQYWSLLQPVFVSAGTIPRMPPAGRILPPGRLPWTPGDNRNPQLVECVKHIAIWILSDLVVTNNRPAVWEDNYKSALETLRNFAEGKTTLRIPLIQPNVGMRVRYGGGVRQQWTY